MPVPLIRYYPPVLKHDSNGYYLLYYCYCDCTQRMERVRIMLNRLHQRCKGLAFRAEVSRMISELNLKLQSGWTPWQLPQSTVTLSSFESAFAAYEKQSKREHRASTYVSYQSVIRIFCFWLELSGVDLSAGVNLFNRSLAIRFMDWLYEAPTAKEIKLRKQKGFRPRKALSNNAWNTYLKKYVAIFTWMVDHEYIDSNPFSKIKTKRKEIKRRAPISDDVRKLLRDYCLEHNRGYLVVLELVFYSLLRPKEIALIQIKDINLKSRLIYVDGSKSKTHKPKEVPISIEICHLLIDLMIDKYPLDYYVIGKDFAPSKEPAYNNCYRKYWSKLRKELGLPNEFQLYSMKDSGIITKFEDGVDALNIMRIADHHSLQTTTAYAIKSSSDLVQKLDEKHHSY